MLAPYPSSSYNGRPSFVNPKYLKKAQSEKPCLYKMSYDKDDLANIFSLNCEETLILEEKSRSKLDKELIKQWKQPITHEITVLAKNLLLPLAIKIKANANEFERALKQEMFEDLEYVQSLEKEVDELESKKAEFLNKYVLLLKECVLKDIMCAILRSFNNIDERTESQCSHLEKLQESECFEIELSNQNENDALEFSDFFEINKLKAQLQDKNIVISELKRLIEKMKGKYVDTKFEKPSVVRQPNAFRFQKPPVLGNVMIKRVYYVEGLNHNLLLVGQLCDADLEVEFRKSTCFVRDFQGNNLLTGTRGSDIYTIAL
ncbi:hypothetical protein Tco_1047205 [Tanacetum coccineum]